MKLQCGYQMAQTLFATIATDRSRINHLQPGSNFKYQIVLLMPYFLPDYFHPYFAVFSQDYSGFQSSSNSSINS